MVCDRQAGRRRSHGQCHIRRLGRGTPESLAGIIDTSAYLTPYSDVVALIVFEHQSHLINLLTRVGWEVRYALYEERMRNTPLDQRLRGMPPAKWWITCSSWMRRPCPAPTHLTAHLTARPAR
jgi:hypothetical protein